jgi:transposase
MSVYGMDLRRKIVAALEQGQTVALVARRFDVDQKTVRSYRRRAAEDRLTPDRCGPKCHTKLTDVDLALMREQVAANPGVTLRQLQGMLSVSVAESTVCRALKKLNLSFKKSR